MKSISAFYLCDNYFYQLGIFNYFNVSREKVIHRARNNLSTSIYKLND